VRVVVAGYTTDRICRILSRIRMEGLQIDSFHYDGVLGIWRINGGGSVLVAGEFD